MVVKKKFKAKYSLKSYSFPTILFSQRRQKITSNNTVYFVSDCIVVANDNNNFFVKIQCIFLKHVICRNTKNFIHKQQKLKKYYNFFSHDVDIV